MLIWLSPLKREMSLLPGNSGEQVDSTEIVLPENAYGDRSDLILGVTVALLVITTIFVGLRVYVRALVIRKWGIDDTVLLSSFLVVLFHDVMMCLATRIGFGKHFWTLSFKTILKSQKYSMLIIILYNVAFTTVKIAFLFQYRRIFPLPKVELICNIGIAFLTLFGISLVISTGITYSMYFGNQHWDSPLNILGWWLTNAAIHLITDIFIFLLPMPLLSRLKLHRLQKSALLASFFLGFFTCAISIIRIISLPESLETTDPTFDSTQTILWSVAELSSAVICCCVPTLRPLVQRSRYCPGRGACNGNGFDDTPGSRCNLRQHYMMTSVLSWASDTAVKKPKPSFSWTRSRQRSQQSTIAWADDIEPATATPMEPVAPSPIVANPILPAPTVEAAMPRVEVNGVQWDNVETVQSEGISMGRNSIRNSICSQGSACTAEGGVRRDLRAQRHMSIALTERDSDDDVSYFGVKEENLDCPTPLSPPPKNSKP
ncbi:hypothetical protein LX32DRAFT_620704 [Colletotrichum zoysiae]|uniref:Rhodopsin domain-containing protein n=1 Tax=Colletotrichum zoysiae TaxID=1216348 RepID=A0AAD9M029_9PEZI|nr:hypothetical protein LX32DRAFT_620704 [Colletotrichum zoysiae]